jgi:hypothetical protein
VTIVTSPGASCTLTVQLIRDGLDLLGNWSARCSDGKQGTGIAFANNLPFNQTLVAGVGGAGVFGGCGWGSVATRQGNRLHGDWSNADNCASGTLRGQLELTKQ